MRSYHKTKQDSKLATYVGCVEHLLNCAAWYEIQQKNETFLQSIQCCVHMTLLLVLILLNPLAR